MLLLQEILRTAFVRRNLLDIPITRKPRKDNHVLICNKAFLGTHKLSTNDNPESFMSSDALLGTSAESWWLASHGKWCPHYYIE